LKPRIPFIGRQFWKAGLAGLVLTVPGLLHAQSVQIQSAPPLVPGYVYPEIGVSSLPGSGAGGGASTGGNPGTVAGGGGSGGITSTGGNSLSTMTSRSWGYQAAQNAQAIGVSSDALAATCMIESGCNNVTSIHGTITGAFQMSNGTYQQMMAEAVAQNPGLAGTINTGLSGQTDPASQAVAAAQYLKDGANYLSNRGISNPTALDVRGYYNFGPQSGRLLASASSDTLMSDVLTHYSSSDLAKNGISPGETVGEWKQVSANKMGTGASSPVLSSQ